MTNAEITQSVEMIISEISSLSDNDLLDKLSSIGARISGNSILTSVQSGVDVEIPIDVLRDAKLLKHALNSIKSDSSPIWEVAPKDGSWDDISPAALARNELKKSLGRVKISSKWENGKIVNKYRYYYMTAPSLDVFNSDAFKEGFSYVYCIGSALGLVVLTVYITGPLGVLLFELVLALSIAYAIWCQQELSKALLEINADRSRADQIRVKTRVGK